MRTVIALGGNALLERGERPHAAIQCQHVRRAAQSLALLAADHQLIVCHGNGPQVGLLGWQVRRDGDGWRRVVASPQPSRLVEIDTLRAWPTAAGSSSVAVGEACRWSRPAMAGWSASTRSSTRTHRRARTSGHAAAIGALGDAAAVLVGTVGTTVTPVLVNVQR